MTQPDRQQAEEIDLDDIDWEALDRANDQVGKDLGIVPAPAGPPAPSTAPPAPSAAPPARRGFRVSGRLQTSGRQAQVEWSGTLCGDHEAVSLAGAIATDRGSRLDLPDQARGILLEFVFEPGATVLDGVA